MGPYSLFSVCFLVLIARGELNECPKGECPSKPVNHEKEKWLKPDSGSGFEDFNLESLGGLLGSFTGEGQGNVLSEMIGSLAGDRSPIELLGLFSQLGAGGEGLDIGSLMQVMNSLSQPKSKKKAAPGEVDFSSMTNLMVELLSNSGGQGEGPGMIFNILSSVIGNNFDAIAKSLPEGGLDDLRDVASYLMETGDIQMSLSKLMKSPLFRSVVTSLTDFVDSSNAVDAQEHGETPKSSKKDPNMLDGYKKLFDSVLQNNKSYFLYFYSITQKIYDNLVSMGGDLSSLDENQIKKIQMQIVARCQAMSGKVDEVISETGSDPILTSSMTIVAGLLYDKHNPESVIKDIRGLLKGIKTSSFMNGLLKQIPKISSILANLQKLQQGDLFKTIGALVTNSLSSPKPRSGQKSSAAPAL